MLLLFFIILVFCGEMQDILQDGLNIGQRFQKYRTGRMVTLQYQIIQIKVPVLK